MGHKNFINISYFFIYRGGKRMKKHIIIIFLIFIIAFSLLSCASGSGSITIYDQSFQANNNKIALLPPRFKFTNTGSIDLGSEIKIGRLIYNTLRKRTQAIWLSPEESVSLIQDANILDQYESLLDGYTKTGIPSKSKLMILSKTLNSPYIALCQVDYKVTGIMGEANYRLAGLTFQVLSANEGKVVLELVGNAQCGSGAYDIGATGVMQMAIDEAIKYFPNAKYNDND